MCNRDCCALKTALQKRRLRILMEKQLLEDEIEKNKNVLETPQSLLYTYKDIETMANFIIEKTHIRPKFGMICGTNLDMLAEMIENPIIIDYSEIPQFPLCTVKGHKGKLYVGTLNGANVICMQGRFHVYEGNQLARCSMPVRVMWMCGAEYMILTCSSSGVNPIFKVGDIMLINDHINMMGMFGNSPLVGPNEMRFGKRHLTMQNAYDEELLHKALDIGKQIGYEDNMHTGVYACIGGPVYETLAEQRLLRSIGVDGVGMSMVHEVIVARHCGMRVFSLCLITVPALELKQPAMKDNLLHQGIQLCSELCARLIYKIQNDENDRNLSTNE